MSEINWKDRCWVTTIYLVSDNKVLLSWNDRVDLWVPIGGHIDPGENPDDAVKREIKEETGFEFEFLDKEINVTNRLVQIHQPHHIQIEKVPHHGIHINLVYFARCTKFHQLEHNDEGDRLKWFSKEELEKLPEDTRRYAQMAIDEVMKK